MIMDELYSFYKTKRCKCYVWTAIAFSRSGRKFYFYYLSKHKDNLALFDFNQTLPQVDTVYADNCFTYDKIYGNKAILGKSSITNIIENLNSQLRDKISYLVRRSKAHSKSFDWLNGRLAMFFVEKNLTRK